MSSERKIQRIAGEVTVENARGAGRQGLSQESVNVLDKKQKKAYQFIETDHKAGTDTSTGKP